MRRINPRILAAVGLGILILIVVVLMTTRRSGPPEDRLADEQAVPAAATEQRCGSQATYDRVKTELFRQAAQLRKSDEAAFDRLSAYASVRMERPLMRSRDAELGTVRCTGRLSLDLPPGLSVVGGRRTLAADIDYVLQPAADGSGDVVMLEGADPIIVPLATLARTGETAPTPAAPADGNLLSPAPPPLADDGLQDPGPTAAPPESADARPSFNCSYARTRGEVAVCRSPELAALDRQMASQYYRAIAAADRRQRRTLTATRDSFIRYRDGCPNDACIAETYRGRMREIRDIMSGDWRPRR